MPHAAIQTALLLTLWPAALLAGPDGGLEPLPWADAPAEVEAGGLRIAASRQLFSGNTGQLSGFEFQLTNRGDEAVQVRVERIELLLARPRPRPWMPDDPAERQPRAVEKPITGCYMRLGDVFTTLVADGAKEPCIVPLAAGQSLRLMVRFELEQASLNRSYWRRGTFRIGERRLQVTGRLTPITFHPQTSKAN